MGPKNLDIILSWELFTHDSQNVWFSIFSSQHSSSFFDGIRLVLYLNPSVIQKCVMTVLKPNRNT